MFCVVEPSKINPSLNCLRDSPTMHSAILWHEYIYNRISEVKRSFAMTVSNVRKGVFMECVTL